ncbi:hypothetical protein CAPTEDRAFT_212888 [Capitella teleta]|uniref:PID domain-containing protein n=1 Tax=Capitella teleta TaxID=283909 RepID=R7TPC4_CAPTE|nr:hypothetical protein CAPTEDRAFT_212888 [Capitella teleta]|eukprot:ELT93346.1 hypothetical protein CAPTEDRAFT_212888 [Capitella teleta]
MSGDSKSLQDSGTGSFGSESDSSPVQPKLTSVNNGSCHNPVNGDKQLREQPASFQVGYLGGMALDKRHTQPMVPWMLTEMKRKKTPVQVNLSIAPSSLKATSEERELFEHNPLTISRFAKSNQHPACFGYLTRNSSGSPYTCHGFVALSEPTSFDANNPNIIKYFCKCACLGVLLSTQESGCPCSEWQYGIEKNGFCKLIIIYVRPSVNAINIEVLQGLLIHRQADTLAVY